MSFRCVHGHQFFLDKNHHHHHHHSPDKNYHQHSPDEAIIVRANVVQVAFGCWVEYRAKILQLRQSSLRKMKQGMLVHCFETWADNVAEIVNVRTYTLMCIVLCVCNYSVKIDPK